MRVAGFCRSPFAFLMCFAGDQHPRGVGRLAVFHAVDRRNGGDGGEQSEQGCGFLSENQPWR